MSRLVDLDQRFERRRRADREAQHAEPHPGRLLERGRVPGRDPHRRMRLGARLRQDVARRHREEPAVERVLGLVPHVTELGTTSSNMSVVSSGSWMPNPRCSVVDEPRPIPNSKRPSDRLSSIATRSATRAGWFTGGVMLKIPLPRWMLSVRAATYAEERLVGRQVRVLREEVVLGRPRVLEPGAIGRNGPRDLVSEPIGLGVLGIEIAQLVGHVQRVEDAELHGSSESHGPTGCRPPPTLYSARPQAHRRDRLRGPRNRPSSLRVHRSVVSMASGVS